jgi:hypothetical protein
MFLSFNLYVLILLLFLFFLLGLDIKGDEFNVLDDKPSKLCDDGDD